MEVIEMQPVLLDEVAAARLAELRSAAERARSVRPRYGTDPRLRVALGRVLMRLGERLAGAPAPPCELRREAPA